MNLDGYQAAAQKYAVYRRKVEAGDLTYPLLGLAEEAGEAAGKLKKHIRDGTDVEKFRADLTLELGDVLWYVAAVTTDLGLKLSDIAAMNLAKLARRDALGTIRGEGDHR